MTAGQDGVPAVRGRGKPVNIKTEAIQFYERGMIDMKKKMAIVLSAILACSMGMTAMAAPSPSIQKEPVAQVVVSPSVGTSNTVTTQAVSVSSDKSAVLPGTTFKTASGQVVDPSAVAMVIALNRHRLLQHL